MNCASARCSRAAGPRRKVKRAPESLAPVSKSRPSGAPRSTWSRGVKSKRRGPCPPGSSAAPRRCRSRRRPTARSSCGRLGSAISMPLQLGLDGLQPLGAVTQLVADAGHLGHRRGGVLALGLELADLLGQALRRACSSSVRVWIVLRSASSAREARHVQKGLRASCALQSRDDAGQVAAQQVDVEHGGSWAVSVRGARRAGTAGRAASAERDPGRGSVTIVTGRRSAMLRSPRPTRQREVHVLLSRRACCALLTAPSARSRSMTCCTRMSGAEAPAVRPTRRRPSNHAGCRSSARVDHVGRRCPGARPARAAGCCCCWSGCRRR